MGLRSPSVEQGSEVRKQAIRVDHENGLLKKERDSQSLKKSYVIAVGLACALTAWVLGGYYYRTAGKEVAAAPEQSEALPLRKVSVRTQDAKPVSKIVVAQGQTEPNRTVTVRAETMGQVAEILADEGKAAILGTSQGPDDMESFRKLAENIPGYSLFILPSKPRVMVI